MLKIPELLIPKIDNIMVLFVENYLSTEFRHEHFEAEAIDEFRSVFYDLAINIINAENRLSESDYKPIVELNLQHGIPYIVVINELGYIKDTFIHELLSVKAVDEVIFLCELFDNLSKDVASIYLKSYIKTLNIRNQLRMKSMSGMKKNIISYYEAHIKWLDDLVNVMRERDTELLPEINSSACVFGKWLECDGKSVISNESKHKEIVSLHKSLHFIASKIENMIETSNCDCHAGMTYLEKAEFLSLEIGTELALLDNKIIMLKAIKDPLTEVLNRSLLEQVFYDQYEIAFITEKSFVLAMCDLDHFKDINDTYGHNEGDFVLKLFSNTLKNELRGSDLIFRYGGDEFMIILPASQFSDVKHLFNNVRKVFRNKLDEHDRVKTKVTLSTGLLEIKPSEQLFADKNLFEEFLIKVDKNLYKAKENGRDCIE